MKEERKIERRAEEILQAYGEELRQQDAAAFDAILAEDEDYRKYEKLYGKRRFQSPRKRILRYAAILLAAIFVASIAVPQPQEKTEYVVSNYWNAFLGKSFPCDSNVVNGVAAADVEKALGTYVTLLERACPIDFGRKAMASFFDKVEKFQSADTSSNVFAFFEKMVAKYLYDPNSPVRNEDLYLPYVSRLAVSELVDPEMRPAYDHDARMCSLNMIGSPAADFTFTDLSGRRHTLYGIKAETTLLFFTNPGCPACKEIIESLTSSERIASLVASGRLAVVNVYIDDELDKWREYASVYPKNWYNGYDQSYLIRSDITYNVRAIPSLYVLDSSKRVQMKDATVEAVLPYLENL